MKRKTHCLLCNKATFYLLIAVFVLLSNSVFSQGAAVNANGVAADPSAMLDVSSNNSGILIPRMTETQKNSISLPAIGLMIYQTDATTGFWYYDGTAWVQSIGLTGATGAVGATGATGPAGVAGFLPSGSAAGNTPYWDGTQWVVSSSNIFNNGGSIGIGTNSPDASAAIDISSTSKGVLIPRLTTSERNAIQNPASGLQIYNTDCGTIDVFVSNDWVQLNQSTLVPIKPQESIHVSGKYDIVWNWNPVAGALGYKINTTDVYATATDIGVNTSYTSAGLACDNVFISNWSNITPSLFYTLYVWAYNDCGNSTVATMSQYTLPCFICGYDTVTFTYKGTQAQHGTIVGQNGTCWLDRNLGASAMATARNHVASYGDLFQWGRLDDGHQNRTSSLTSTLSSGDNPGHSKFITNNSSPMDWRNPQNNSLWQGVNGISNPCPAGWRVPSYTELYNEMSSWSALNYNGAINSPLRFPCGGNRHESTGNVTTAGTGGYYWTSTLDGQYIRDMRFTSSSAQMGSYYRAGGFSVRCIKDY